MTDNSRPAGKDGGERYWRVRTNLEFVKAGLWALLHIVFEAFRRA